MKVIIIWKNWQLWQELCKTKESWIDIMWLDRSELNILDFKLAEEVIKKMKPDIIINTSAYHRVSDCELSQKEAFEMNCTALNNLAKLCNNQNIYLISYSTDYVFDWCKKSPYLEDDKVNPLQIYGLSKLAWEYALLNYNPWKWCIIRTNWVYWWWKIWSTLKWWNFILNILKQAESCNWNIEIASDQFVNPTYAWDLAIATMKLIKNPSNINWIYHFGNDWEINWSSFAESMFKILWKKIAVIPTERWEYSWWIKRPLYSVLWNARWKKIWIELPSIEEWLIKYLNTL